MVTNARSVCRNIVLFLCCLNLTLLSLALSITVQHNVVFLDMDVAQ